MTQHSKSLFISIIIHSILFIGLFYTFHEVVSFIGHKKEKKVCIKLGCIHSVQSQRVIAKKIEKKVKKHQKTVKKILKKNPPKKKIKKKKKKIKKKIIHKKVIPLKKIKKVPKPPKIEKIEKIEEVSTQKEARVKEEAPVEKKRTKKIELPKEAQEKSSETASAQTKYVNIHLVEIAKLLQENLYYPRRARKRGIEGDVIVSFTLKEDATVINSKIVSSSDKLLSRAALKTLENLSGKFPKPDEALTLTVPIRYSLH